MNVILHELRMFRRSTLTWIGALVMMAVSLFSLFPAFFGQAEIFAKLMASFPQQVLDAFGISIDMIASLQGYYMFVISYIALAGAVQAMNVGTLLLARESQSKTADFLLTKPVTRSTLMVLKLAAGLCVLLVTNLAYLAAATVMAFAVTREPFDYKLFFMLSLILFFIQLIFFAFGFLASTAFRKIKSVVSLSLATVFSFFILSMFSSAIKDDAMRFLTPFRYFDGLYIVNHLQYEQPYLVLWGVLVSVSLVLGVLIYRRRDIHAA